jgi:hypothetical protein
MRKDNRAEIHGSVSLRGNQTRLFQIVAGVKIPQGRHAGRRTAIIGKKNPAGTGAFSVRKISFLCVRFLPLHARKGFNFFYRITSTVKNPCKIITFTQKKYHMSRK